jgi:hypothetical protein
MHASQPVMAASAIDHRRDAAAMTSDAEDRVGLCRRCTHSRRIESGSATYFLCQKSRSDPNLAKYPRLPVIECHAFSPLHGYGRHGGVCGP